ncbi:hypothetical protein GUITHDRAFT_113871 [Guillardia theta CCMP2712]|uniref:Uncharacterized protein n=1 Tax=Guillardia theta (strain CCMP2712) TaxID=905079 RepID=L1IW68_GUITC|nr:hypothetical protein GUITHDRAFT_113871 [Guillardia theta CCMP2712]EKX40134.1 hypothetical protein GUITHDRAFT_113871 [Guillardia theta CCMP2712]|eukprot:XP_005827114.1 hypothetical protein GUITHDRAFT_113871 [Guillardia theta CCMP2712]
MYPMEAGTEISISYTSIAADLVHRQKRLRSEYGVAIITSPRNVDFQSGFVCNCQRCKIEKEIGVHEGRNEGSESEEADALLLYLAKYSCTDAECGGTLAPIIQLQNEEQGNKRSSKNRKQDEVVMECNRCAMTVKGLQRLEEVFADQPA